MSSAEEKEQKLQATQRKKRNLVNNINKGIIDYGEQILRKPTEPTEYEKIEVSALLEALEEATKKLKNFNDDLEDLIIYDGELEKETEHSFRFDFKIKTFRLKLMKFVETKEVNSDTPVETSAEKGVKLPKITLKQFNGNPLEWDSFRETYQSTIHENKKLSCVEKFTYLRSYLDGTALQAIVGFPLTGENYNEAWNLLVERFGNPQLIISSHMNNLIKLNPVNVANITEFRTFYDIIDGNVRALKNLHINADHFGPLLIPIILEKLPDNLRLQISRKLGRDNWFIDEFLECIKREVSARESYQYLKDDPEEDSPYTSSSLYSGKSKHSDAKFKKYENKKKCVFCKSDSHYSDKCGFVSDVESRRNILKSNRHCFNCLQQGHIKKDCRVKNIKCYKCKTIGKHHTALCDIEKETNGNNEKKEGSTFLVNQEKSVLLQTANVYVTNESEDEVFTAKILMDSCSQQTYVTAKLVRELKLQPIRKVTVGIKTFNSSEASVQKLKEYAIILKSLKNNRKISIKALAVPTISSSLSDQCIPTVIEQNPEIEKFELADNGHSRTKEIDVLVGADVHWQLFSGEIKLINDGLVLLKSMFGWILNGWVFSKERNQSVNFVSSSVLKIGTTYEDECLTNQVQKFWDLDTIGIKEKEISKYEQVIEDIEFENGRYKVRLPFKENHAVIPDYYDLCKNRLSKLYNRLSQDRNLLENYDSIIQEQLKYGIVEEVDNPGTFGNVSYLPHKEVLRNDKASTKVRVVFDASAKTKNNVSLNEILYKGPCLTPKLYDLLVKFRLYPVALVADIEKAYLQILIDERDRDFMRFLWYDDVFATKPNIVKLRFCRVIFGATCSQYLLNAMLHNHAMKFENVDPDLSRKIRSHFYVDDLSTGVNSTEQGINLYKKIKLSFSDIGFNVRKWRSNDKDLFDLIYENEKKISKDSVCYDDLKCSRVLGILWDEEKDIFILGVDDLFKNASNINPTKRNILSIICGVYDPVGYLQPIIIKLKLLFQEICLLNITWDEEIREDLLSKWVKIVSDLRNNAKIQINR